MRLALKKMNLNENNFHKKILLNGGQLSDDIDTDLFNNGIVDA
jgi:hypothetical protein